MAFSNKATQLKNDFQFDRERFINELLSLGIPSITPKLAKKICKEVEIYLEGLNSTKITPELISDIVKFKLEELGVLPLQKPKSNIAPLPPKPLRKTKKVEKSFAQEVLAELNHSETANAINTDTSSEETTHQETAPIKVSHLWDDETVFDEDPTKVSLSEPLITETVEETTVITTTSSITPTEIDEEILPPKNKIALGEKASLLFKQFFLKPDFTIEKLFANLAQNIAHIDSQYGSKQEAKLLEIQYYNLLASGEFLPHPMLWSETSKKPFHPYLWLYFSGNPEEAMAAIPHLADNIHATSTLTIHLALDPHVDDTFSNQMDWLKVFDACVAAYQGIKYKLVNKESSQIRVVINVEHPEIELILKKLTQSQYANIQIVLALGDLFLQSVAADTFYALKHPLSSKNIKLLSARFIHEQILQLILQGKIHAIHFPGHELPGFNFEENVAQFHQCYFNAMQVGAINLMKVVEHHEVAWSKLKRIVHGAIQFLDNAIDLCSAGAHGEKDKPAQDRYLALTPIGLADMLIELAIPFGSERAQELIEELYDFIRMEALEASRNLASARGAYASWEIDPKSKAMRNKGIIALVQEPLWQEILQVQPNSLPLQTLTMRESSESGEELYSIYPPLAKACYQQGLLNPKLATTLPKSNSIQNMDELSEEIRELFITQADLSPLELTEMLTWMMKDCDYNLNLKIVLSQNLDSEALRKILAKAYQEKLNFLAFNIQETKVDLADFTDEEDVTEIASLSTTAMTSELAPSPELEVLVDLMAPTEPSLYVAPTPYTRPQMMDGKTFQFSQNGTELYVTANYQENTLKEIFIHTNRDQQLAPKAMITLNMMINLLLSVGYTKEELTTKLHMLDWSNTELDAQLCPLLLASLESVILNS